MFIDAKGRPRSASCQSMGRGPASPPVAPQSRRATNKRNHRKQAQSPPSAKAGPLSSRDLKYRGEGSAQSLVLPRPPPHILVQAPPRVVGRQRVALGRLRLHADVVAVVLVVVVRVLSEKVERRAHSTGKKSSLREGRREDSETTFYTERHVAGEVLGGGSPGFRTHAHPWRRARRWPPPAAAGSGEGTRQISSKAFHLPGKKNIRSLPHALTPRTKTAPPPSSFPPA